MLVFENDYSEGAHEKVLEALRVTNMEQLSGYGSDPYCEMAKKKIRKACGCEDADVYFLVGGTQTNQIVIASLLKPYEGVIAAETGHVSLHEAGAIESTGHKVLQIPSHEGKMDALELHAYLKGFYEDENHEHMVYPGMVYISYPTEYGTIYSKNELMSISQVCKTFGIPLYVDGARLGYGLSCEACDLTLSELAETVDVFYIGGTKVGALCGEAVVFSGMKAPAHFMTFVKQHGALLAKGRLLGIQFDALFTDDLYYKISKHAIEMASRIKADLKKKDYVFYLDSPTNQIFIVLTNEQYEEIRKEVRVSFWEKYDENHTVIRIATSWATKAEEVEKLLTLL